MRELQPKLLWRAGLDTLFGYIVHLQCPSIVRAVLEDGPLQILPRGTERPARDRGSYEVLLGICGRHVGIAPLQKGVRHVRFQHRRHSPFYEVVLVAISPGSTKANLALPVLVVRELRHILSKHQV